jgi:endonuclease/exonuclease/phosphatase family metal-dependent hydrolase
LPEEKTVANQIFEINFKHFFYLASQIEKTNVRQALKSILLLLNVIAILSLFAGYLSVYIAPDEYWIPSLFGLAYPFVLVANIVFVVFWLLVKPRLLLLSLISILVGWGFVSRYIQFKGSNTEDGEVKVVSYNVKYFIGDEDLTQKENADKIVSFLEEQNADIICLQEARLRKNSIFNLPNTVKKLETIKHYQYARSSITYGSVTMTRYPIVDMGEIRFEESRNMTIYTDVVIKKDTVRIFNVHLQSYKIDPNKYSIIDSPGVNQEEDLKEVREMGIKFKKAFQMRAEQVREIKKYIDESPYDVIVCGDFNDTPISFSYQQLKGDLTDAFVNSGKGVGRTYIGKLPSFRIDNIFHSDKFESYNFQTYDFRMSDHLPISCDLIVK